MNEVDEIGKIVNVHQEKQIEPIKCCSKLMANKLRTKSKENNLIVIVRDIGKEIKKL